MSNHLSTAHQILHLSEDLGRSKLRIYKLEQRHRPDRLIQWDTAQSGVDSWAVSQYNGLLGTTTDQTHDLRRRYWYLFGQFGKFWRGIKEQYGVF